MPTTLYIAETDERNAVSAVWVKPKGKRNAQVFDPQKHNFDPQEDAEFSGAPESVVKQWLLHQRVVNTE